MYNHTANIESIVCHTNNYTMRYCTLVRIEKHLILTYCMFEVTYLHITLKGVATS